MSFFVFGAKRVNIVKIDIPLTQNERKSSSTAENFSYLILEKWKRYSQLSRSRCATQVRWYNMIGNIKTIFMHQYLVSTLDMRWLNMVGWWTTKTICLNCIQEYRWLRDIRIGSSNVYWNIHALMPKEIRCASCWKATGETSGGVYRQKKQNQDKFRQATIW